MTDWDRSIDDLNERSDRQRDFIEKAIEERRLPRSNEALFGALSDLLQELERIRYGKTVGPDGQGLARLALGDLMHIWVDVEESEAVYLGES